MATIDLTAKEAEVLQAVIEFYEQTSSYKSDWDDSERKALVSASSKVEGAVSTALDEED